MLAPLINGAVFAGGAVLTGCVLVSVLAEQRAASQPRTRQSGHVVKGTLPRVLRVAVKTGDAMRGTIATLLSSDVARIRACALVATASFLTAILRVVPLSVCLLVLTGFAASAFAAAQVYARVAREGLLRRLSPTLQHTLTHTTLLEWIRDDSVSRSIAPYIPLLLCHSSQEVSLYLDSAPLSVREKLLRRGLVHVLPHALRALVLGSDAHAATHDGGDESSDASGGWAREGAAEASSSAVSDLVIPSEVAATDSEPLAVVDPSLGGPHEEHEATQDVPWHTQVLTAVLKRRAHSHILSALDAAGLSHTRLTAAGVGLSALAAARIMVAIMAQRRGAARGTSTGMGGVINAGIAAAAVAAWIGVLLRSRATNGLEEFERLRVAKALQTLETLLQVAGNNSALRAVAPFLEHWSRVLGVSTTALWQRACEIAGVGADPAEPPEDLDRSVDRSTTSARARTPPRAGSWALSVPLPGTAITSTLPASAGAGFALLIMLLLLLRQRK